MLLGETDGSRGTNQTSPDVAFEVTLQADFGGAIEGLDGGLTVGDGQYLEAPSPQRLAHGVPEGLVVVDDQDLDVRGIDIGHEAEA